MLSAIKQYKKYGETGGSQSVSWLYSNIMDLINLSALYSISYAKGTHN